MGLMDTQKSPIMTLHKLGINMKLSGWNWIPQKFLLKSPTSNWPRICEMVYEYRDKPIHGRL
jgi:hypothetical protein